MMEVPMISVLALAALATTAPTTGTTPTDGYFSWIKDSEVHVRFYDLSKIHGPFKFYVSASGTPAAGCATCPSGTSPDYVVPPTAVFQKWPPGARFVETRFPLSLVGNLPFFYFTAVTVTAEQEIFLVAGAVPHGRSD